MSQFQIGQQVQCIKDFHISRRQGFNAPRFMQIYTVRAHCPCSYTPAILLEELHNRQVIFASNLLRGEASFAECRFVPLQKIEKEEELVIRTALPNAAWRKLNV